MITELKIKNFKSLKDISLDIKPLNILTGLNGMGKSSLIQTLLLLTQNSESLSKESSSLQLKGEFVDIGKGKDALYYASREEEIEIGIGFNGVSIKWIFIYDSDNEYLITNSEKYDKKLSFSVLSLFNGNFQYLNAEREPPKVIYDKSSWHVNNKYKQIGNKGEFTVHFLNAHGNGKIANEKLLHRKAKSNILLHQVDAWLSEISPGIKLNTTEIPGTNNLILDFQFETSSLYTSRFNPKNVGFGITYVLPVITALLSFPKDRLIIIENPESHIHPRGQAELGKLIGLAAESGAQIFIETHSDHILNGIRVAVKKGLIQKENVGIFYFEKENLDNEQYSKISNIKIDKNGELSEYPKDFLDEWNSQLLELI